MLLNFEAFEKAIDCIGGLEATVDKQLDYDDNWGNLHIHLKPGRQTLNGNQAMGFVRYRQSKDGDAESDFVRIGRQQELLRAAREKLSSAGVMFKVPRALDIIRNDADSNLTPAQMMCLAMCLKTLPSDSNIRMETVPALEGSRVLVHPDTDKARELVKQMFLDNQP
jgi:anionic cell wall polymer biosynthesis LytR-Cps2A-Psr (LCP) family protein